ncbi:hypothetical protein [Kitasatospora purpeofusca]|uniref:hypothetical protein n=1 Tax=Kitasatospora purpeofusca TaxID=67352 RepID=UPI00224F1CFB|nr:hypothetical protein [Kitasatospora purpeofusca]MCX4755711.1 hypothetical protein [Kitasatospora purpeofusca]WSR36427.1 hypothetical protein OG715_39030 [Kitasatospora purpeofusca]WSR44713.1 hypothetical protein OG196_39920 [Kitasatospora purpeofusca]
MLRRPAFVLAATGLTTALLLPVSATGSAVAAPLLTAVTCTGQSQISYSPPLTNTAKPTAITAHGDFGALASPGLCLGVGTSVTSAHYDESFSNPSQSCSSGIATQSGTRVFTWNDGQTSTFPYTTTLTSIGGQSASVRTGTISAGRFAGLAAEQITIVPSLDPLACDGDGIAHTTSRTTLSIGP